MSDSPPPGEPRLQRLRRWSSYASVSVAIVLVTAKAAAWFATDSLSLLAIVIDALVDVFAAIVTLLGIRFALRPADALHRFGYGKAESLAALIQALLLIGAACVLVFDGLHRLISPHTVVRLDFGVGVIGGSTLLTTLLVIFESHVAEQTHSHAIAADRLHHLSDIVANLAVLLALLLTQLTGWSRVDPLFALAIAAFFGWSALTIVSKAAETLLDRELSTSERQQITELVMGYANVRGLHDLRTRSTGLVRFIEFHLELDGNLSVQDAHTIADEIEHELMNTLRSSEISIHVEPAGINDDRLDDRLYQSFRKSR